MSRLTAIVPATNDPPTLQRCVDAIRSARDTPEQLIVVTHAGSPGPAAARNEGARRADGDVLVFVDADVIPRSDAFERIRAAFDADAGLVALFGSYDDSPEAPGVVSRFRNLLHHHTHHASAGPAETFWAGLGAVRRDAFVAAGGFDQERYRVPSVEDIDLGMRLTARGARVRLDPDVQGTHLKAWTLREMVRTDLLQRGIPWIALLLRRGRRSRALNLGWQHRLSAASSVGCLLAVRARRPLLAAGFLISLAALNARFYALLQRRVGRRGAVLGVGLHVIHHGTSTLSVPLGILAYLRDRALGRS
ncbi:MAG: glycosyltransferase family A protein [Gaiellaceae bacterium]